MSGMLGQLGGSFNANEAQKEIESGGQIPPGCYRAKLDGVSNWTADGDSTPSAIDMVFVIQGGQFDGRKVKYKLWLVKPEEEQSEDPKVNERVGWTRNRIFNFGKCLGLFAVAKDGKVLAIEGKHDFIDCLDAECIIETVVKPQKNNPTATFTDLSSRGVYAKDDKTAMAKIGKPAAAAPPKGGSGTPAKGEAAKPAPSVKGRI